MKLAAFFLLCASCAFAQLDTYSVTVTASRTMIVPPDQVVFQLSFESGVGVTVDAVIAAGAGAGIALDFPSSIYTYQDPTLGTRLEWWFSLTVPFSAMRGTLDQLATAQRRLQLALPLTYTVAGTAVSPQASAAQACSTSDLMADARTQALSLANAGGFALGPVISMSNFIPPPQVSGGYLIPVTVLFQNAIQPAPPATIPLACGIVVKFRLQPQ